MGGMLATRFTTQYPDSVERLVVYNPIGLADNRFNRPMTPIDEIYERRLQTDYQSTRRSLSRYVAHNPEAWNDEFETYRGTSCDPVETQAFGYLQNLHPVGSRGPGSSWWGCIYDSTPELEGQMMRPILPRHSSVAVLVALTLALVVAGSAQQTPNPSRRALSDEPQVFASLEQQFRVVPLKGLSYPWGLAFLPNGDMLITETGGQLRIVRGGVLDPDPVAGMPEVNTVRHKGLMDIVLHPRFSENQFVYFTYSKSKGDDPRVATATLARGRFDGGGALTEVRDLFEADAVTSGSQASRIAFGPDGKLYMTVGIPTREAVGTAESAQDPADHAGKVLRLNDDGTAPDDNPFVGTTGYRPEIYALGIRNALGLMFHPETGELWEHENGPQGGDEINIIRPGLNYGWPVISYGRAYSGDRTGTFSGPTKPEPCAPGMEQPFIFWNPSIAVSGMIFYTGDRFPAWTGNILVGALRGTQLQRVILNDKGFPVRHESLLTELRQRIRDVKQGPDGLIYVLTDEEDGALLRLEPVAERG